MMGLLKDLMEGLKFILEGVSRIFKLTDDQYPATGMIPYNGDTHSKIWYN
jgi:hypothetical protein